MSAELPPKKSLTEKAIDSVLYMTGDSCVRSEFSQDLGRKIDRLIGSISGNPCHGCDDYYEYHHGRSRFLKADLVEVETPWADNDDAKLELEGLVLSCRRKLSESLKGEERFRACSSRSNQGRADFLEMQFEEWSKERASNPLQTPEV